MSFSSQALGAKSAMISIPQLEHHLQVECLFFISRIKALIKMGHEANMSS